METPIEDRPYIRKLIDIPKPLVKDLKLMALNSDKCLKIFLQDLIVDYVIRNRAGDSENLISGF